MFNPGITALLAALPDFPNLDQELARRLLSSAYTDALELRAEPDTATEARREETARLALALTAHAVLAPSADQETVRACSFVAAEALSLLEEQEEPLQSADARPELHWRRYRKLEAGLLYLIAGYDSNAAVAIRGVSRLKPPADATSARLLASDAVEDAAAQIGALLRIRQPPRRRYTPSADPLTVSVRVRCKLWNQLSDAAELHNLWMRGQNEPGRSPAVEPLEQMIDSLLGAGAVSYAEIALLARLLRMACVASAERALRSVERPDDDGSFAQYVAGRAAQRPLLWPAAQRYAGRCLLGDRWHAAVAVPTGAGKSGVAELASAFELQRGWVIYLAPTNALVAQIQRDLGQALADYPNIQVRGFFGGSELTGTIEDTIAGVSEREILVMTPEKCTLALRRSPEAFATVALCICDECHLIGDRGTRGVIAEMVLAHILTLAPQARVLLLSALMDNPQDLCAWLQTATGASAEPIREPWRPTRTLRAVAGVDRRRFAPILRDAQAQRERERVKQREFSAPAALLAGLQGAWQSSDPEDFTLVRTAIDLPLNVQEHTFGYSSNDITAALSGALARHEHRVLAFVPRNRHWAFSLAAKIDVGALDTELDELVEDLLLLARHELGVPSQVETLLRGGVAVHTSAMLDHERRASELAFTRGQVPVMLATGTLAQGLNLPATAVVITGTQVGYDSSRTTQEGAERAKAQLLNAVGRAGRAQFASRSLAIVVPEKPLVFVDRAPGDALAQVGFYSSEDATVTVTSRLDALIDRALRDDDSGEGMTTEELAAFAVLPLATETVEPADVIRRTYGAWQRNAANRESAQVIAGSLVRLGARFLGEQPRWVAEAAYLAGLTVPQTLEIHATIGQARQEFSQLEDVGGWVTATVRALELMTLAPLSDLFEGDTFNGTRASAVLDADASNRERGAAWTVLRGSVSMWLSGATYEQIGRQAVGEKAEGNSARHQQAPLPKVIRMVNNGFGYALARAVGGVNALYTSAVKAGETDWQLPPMAARALDLAPLAVRLGAGDPGALAWMRFAGLPRRVAHVVAEHSAPPDDLADAERWAWVDTHAKALREESLEDQWEIDEVDAEAIAAWRRVT
jgi:superfamily II DNA/RNA helicase